MKSKTETRLMRPSEVAEALSLKESTIRAWILARRIFFVRVGKRAVRIPQTEVERIITQGAIPAREERR